MIKKREEKKNQKGKPQIFIVGGEITASMMALTKTLKNVSKKKKKKKQVRLTLTLTCLVILLDVLTLMNPR